MITSQDGLATHTYTIRVADAPSAPTLGTVTPGEGYLTISWTAPDDTGRLDVESYDIRYIETATDETTESNWTVVEDVWTATSEGDLQYVITGLTGETLYDIQVRAGKRQGHRPLVGNNDWDACSAEHLRRRRCSDRCDEHGADFRLRGAAGIARHAGGNGDSELVGGYSHRAVGWRQPSGTPQRVTRLAIPGKGLDGTIPSVLGRLSMLTHLNLRSNDRLTGEIPSELGT